MGEESADEKLEIIPVADVLVRDIVLENGKLSAQCSQQLKRTLFALRFQTAIDETEVECPKLRAPSKGIPRGSSSSSCDKTAPKRKPDVETTVRPLHQAAPSASVVRGIKIFVKSASPDI